MNFGIDFSLLNFDFEFWHCLFGMEFSNSAGLTFCGSSFLLEVEVSQEEACANRLARRQAISNFWLGLLTSKAWGQVDSKKPMPKAKPSKKARPC